jgi:hypothetical protein
MYGRAVYESDPAKYESKECPAEWWSAYQKLMDMYLDIDAEPWQEAAVRENVIKYGRDFFKGIDTFGLY